RLPRWEEVAASRHHRAGLRRPDPDHRWPHTRRAGRDDDPHPGGEIDDGQQHHHERERPLRRRPLRRRDRWLRRKARRLTLFPLRAVDDGVIELAGVSKVYRSGSLEVVALRDIFLEIETGE